MENTAKQITIPPFENGLIIKSTNNFRVQFGYRGMDDNSKGEQRVLLTPTNKNAEKLLVDFANRNGTPLSTREVDVDGKKNQVRVAMFREDPQTLLEKLNKSGDTEGKTFGSGVPSLTFLEDKLLNPANQEPAFKPNLEIKTKDALLTAAKDILINCKNKTIEAFKNFPNKTDFIHASVVAVAGLQFVGLTAMSIRGGVPAEVGTPAAVTFAAGSIMFEGMGAYLFKDWYQKSFGANKPEGK